MSKVIIVGGGAAGMMFTCLKKMKNLAKSFLLQEREGVISQMPVIWRI